MKTLRILLAGAILAASPAALATTVKNGKVVWTFLAGAYNTANYDSAGIPKKMEPRVTLPSSFLSRVANALPERVDIRNRAPEMIADDAAANVRLKKEADVFVTFVHEGAGYKNSVGFFTFPDNAVPTKKTDVRETIVFPNASFHNDGGSSAGLKSGDTVKLGRFPAGTNIGFVVVANGFDSKSGVVTNVTGGAPGGDWTFYTLRALNPESTPEMRAHTVLLNDTATGMFVLGMEDLMRASGCDHDFNDMVYTLTTYPEDAFETEDVVVLPTPDDQDNDGVKDGVDDFPEDGDRAFEVPFAPGTAAFEDSWPRHGDYDFNDLVVHYQYGRVINKDNKVVDLTARFQVQAWGSTNQDGLALHLPGILPAQVKSATLSINGSAATALAPEAGQAELVLPVAQDVADYLASSAKCQYFNTEAGCYGGAGPVFELKITFLAPLAQDVLGVPPYDPFVFRTLKRGQEIHLVDVPPTSLADMTLFRTQDDNSDPAAGRWYRSVCNLPWALDFPAAYAWPLEGTEILEAYPPFLDWVASSGAQAKDWYVTGGVSQFLWTRP